MSVLDDLRVVEEAQDNDLKKEIYNEVISTLTPYMRDLLQQVHRCKAEIDVLRAELDACMEMKVDKSELHHLLNKIRGYHY